MNSPISTDLDNLLKTACDIRHWDKMGQVWSTSDGNWYSLSPMNLQGLQQTIETLSNISKLEKELQCIIANEALDLIKNILTCPSPLPDDRQTTRLTWHLMFNLVQGNLKNQIKIWDECGQFLLDFMRQDVYNNDTCRMIVYNIYALGGVGRVAGAQILRILLNNFHVEKQPVPLKEQELTLFLEHYVTDEEDIDIMYLTLNGVEKIALMQFVTDYVSGGTVASRISLGLMNTICNDFIAQSKAILESFTQEEADIRELFALFESVAHMANDRGYALNTFDFELLRNVGQLIRLVCLNEENAERVFTTVKRNCNEPLLELILKTISNLIKDNNEHKEKARAGGLIEILVDLMAAKGGDKTMYRCIIFALIDICQTNPLNMQYVEMIVKKKNLVNSTVFEHFIKDVNYKGR